jgi:hypothetical protein
LTANEEIDLFIEMKRFTLVHCYNCHDGRDLKDNAKLSEINRSPQNRLANNDKPLFAGLSAEMPPSKVMLD